ncbi:CPBP family intramembrane glutamic endopeptidase [Demequina salsinemoris]|uniref:CPBP family intramembrane glutamic endopeptidase n=1 Tax=Demequina salsinemoris TaxID=577470 RepID=UPI0009FC75FB|nr:CPBP family intramembrane glutamic endopeptidase [Demequina salsinemoris]
MTATTMQTRSVDSRDLPDDEQYPVWRILAIWAATALPMGLGLWWVMPTFIAPRMEVPALGWLLLATVGLVWQAVLALLILRREVRPFTWENLKRRLWLDKPRSPRTGRASWHLLWWAVGAAVVWAGIAALGLVDPLNDALVHSFPALAPPDYALIENLATPELVGQWWIMGVVLVLIVCNYLIGEELIFRGILLPKMRGAFGRWDVIANGILFSWYHVHLIWEVPGMMFTDWIYAYLTKRYRSYWVGALFHGIDGVFLLIVFPLALAGVIQS